MIIVTNTNKIKKGFGQVLVDRFDKVGMIEEMEGFLGLEVLFTENLKDFDEVTISTRWESREAFNAWTKSEAFRKAHSHQGDKGGQPEYVIENKIGFYDVRVTRHPSIPA